MQFKSKEEIAENIEILGLSAISKFSSIRVLARKYLPLEGMLAIEKMVAEIECTLWSIMPLGLSNETEKFNEQCEHLKHRIASFLVAAQAMQQFMSDSKGS